MVQLTSEQATREFGEQVGGLLRGGETIELIGDVGAGKTTFVRGLAKGMGISETVQSPSFTINRVYDAPDERRLVHYDFYRLSDAGIMADELDESIHDKQTVVVIEWADTVAEILPTDRLTLSFISTGEESRQVDVRSSGEQSLQLMEKLK